MVFQLAVSVRVESLEYVHKLVSFIVGCGHAHIVGQI
jgi:hypothetical protein